VVPRAFTFFDQQINLGRIGRTANSSEHFILATAFINYLNADYTTFFRPPHKTGGSAGAAMDDDEYTGWL
jgi:hypothetical protein